MNFVSLIAIALFSLSVTLYAEEYFHGDYEEQDVEQSIMPADTNAVSAPQAQSTVSATAWPPEGSQIIPNPDGTYTVYYPGPITIQNIPFAYLQCIYNGSTLIICYCYNPTINGQVQQVTIGIGPTGQLYDSNGNLIPPSQPVPTTPIPTPTPQPQPPGPGYIWTPGPYNGGGWPGRF
ncbi:MAG: hypothetical protein HY537_14380 [Deltaproteobacteria bacterium]|nr:hypothetical protein [Deltaproteobacteria bacterium]